MRPHRGSRAMSTMGANVQFTPAAAASRAAARAVLSAAAGSHVAASASGIGKIVRYPWITSRPRSNGMWRRDSVTAMRWASRVAWAPARFRNPPIKPLRTCSSCAGLGWLSTEGRLSWPSFSSRVMRATSESISRPGAARCAAAGPGATRPRATSAVKQPSWMRIEIPLIRGRKLKRGAENLRGLGRGLFLGLVLVAFTTPAAFSQTSTGSIRGYVTDAQGAALAEARVTAVNGQTRATREATSQHNGFYSLPGLVPGEYDLTVRRIGSAAQARRVRVLIGEVLTLDFQLGASAVEVQAVTVVAERTVETRTSEVATNVTQEQINNLPTPSRNFLDLASLAPGTSTQNDRINGIARSFSAGAQSADQTNLFIDGASYKNDLIHGGSVGEDRSRGNPFPRNAVQEFRILTQNYKAEYQKASSAIITATTKSGGNVWTGNAFFAYQNKDLVALDSFQIRDKHVADSIGQATGKPSTFLEPDYKRDLVGLSAGGPIIKDRLHFFGSYEGNYQDRTNRVNIVPPAGFPALDTINFTSRNGSAGSPFRSTLVFGKLTYDASEHSSLELSLNTRHETDIRDFGDLRPLESGVHFKNDVTTGILKYSHFQGAWLDEAALNYQRARDNPSPVPGNETVNRFYGGSFCCAQIGPDISIQDFTQERIGFRNDLTYSGLHWQGQHVVKTGVSIDFLNYKVIKQNGVIPRFVYEQFAPNPTVGTDSFKIPDRVEFRAGNPNFVTDNNQIGAYLQDDWSPIERLVLNLGIRWDYETRMLNYDYATPQAIVDSLTKYASQLFLPIDPNRYFTDGTQRPRFKGAFQPRLGLSYALDQAGKTTLYGGFGIFYDRTLFDQAIEEKFALQQPNIVIRFRQAGDTTSGRVA